MLIGGGIIGIAVGLVCLFHPFATLFALAEFISFWAMLTGALELLAAFQLRNVIENENMLLLVGVLSIILGIAIAVNPRASLVLYAYFIGAYAVISGIVLIRLSLNLRRMGPAAEVQAP